MIDYDTLAAAVAEHCLMDDVRFYASFKIHRGSDHINSVVILTGSYPDLYTVIDRSGVHNLAFENDCQASCLTCGTMDSPGDWQRFIGSSAEYILHIIKTMIPEL